MIKKQAINELPIKLLECFRSRGQWLFTFIGKKDSFYILRKKGLCTEPPSPQGRKFRIFLRGGLTSIGKERGFLGQKKIRSTYLFHYTNHTKQNLIFRWGVGKHALQTSRGSMVFTKVKKFQKIHYVKMKNFSGDNLVTHNSSQIPLVLDRTGIYKYW